MSMKNPPAGIEPATFRFVAQHLNHCATAVPVLTTCSFEKIITESLRKSKELIKPYLSTSFARRPTNAPAVTEDPF